MKQAIKLENITDRNNNCFTKWLKNIITLIPILSIIVAVLCFFIDAKFIAPLEKKIDKNTQYIQNHKEFCSKSLPKLLNERPINRELNPRLNSIEQNIKEIKELFTIFDRKIEDIYKMLSTKKN